MATPNYAFAKRQRDLEKKKKKEEKQQRKSASTPAESDSEPAMDASAETPVEGEKS